MPNKPEPESEPNDFNLPPELSAFENRLRDLPSGQTSTIDRDDLMFRSGWAAAMAERAAASERLRNPEPSRNLASRWGWPVLTGTFATIAAALAIALWASPERGEDSQMAITPDVSPPQLVVDSNLDESTDDQSKDSPALASTEPSTFSNPIEQAIRPFIENMVGSDSALSSSLAMQSRLLRGIELGKMQRPRINSVGLKPKRAPLKANSYRNQELWEQL